MKFLLFLLSLTLFQFTAQAQISQIASGDPIQADKINSMIVEINKMYDIGDIRNSLLTESQFQSRNGSCWVLMNGQSVSGSLYESLTGRSNLPSAAGRFLRNAGGSAAALALTQEDDFKAHNHGGGDHSHSYSSGTSSLNSAGSYPYPSSVLGGTRSAINNSGTIIASQGGSETRPKNLTVNMFVKINNCN
jgi:hypothetical protein